MKHAADKWAIFKQLQKPESSLDAVSTTDSNPEQNAKLEPETTDPQAILQALGIPVDPEAVIEKELAASRPEELPAAIEFDFIPGPGEAHLQSFLRETSTSTTSNRYELPEDIDFANIPGPGEEHKKTPRVHLVHTRTEPTMPSGIAQAGKRKAKPKPPSRVIHPEKPRIAYKTTCLEGVDIPLLTRPVSRQRRRQAS